MENRDIRSLNRARVLAAIVAQGRIARSQLVAATGLSKASISRVTRELLDDGLVVSDGSQPETLRVHADAFAACGVDLGATSARFVVINAHGEVVGFTAQPTPRDADPAGLAAWIVANVAEVTSGRPGPRFITMGVPGVVDPHTSMITEAPNLPAVESGVFLDALEAEWPEHLRLDNDANLAVLGEHVWNGFGPDSTTVMLTLSTGIGAGVILGGELLRGRDGRVGELRMIPLGVGPDRIEDVLSGAGVAAFARSRSLGPGTPADLLRGTSDGHRELRRRAHAGLELAASIAVVAYEASTLIVGGALSEPLADEIDAVAETIRRRFGADTRVMVTSLGDLAFVAGTLALSVDRAFASLGVARSTLATAEVTTAIGQLRTMIGP
ncbi:ROK family transcriptional regulator [Jiangella anatolica]|uniref:HTH marR-type domain-containing protein n=1 Tax=Jiangella anatolica TaxID=2670374 RepID=A0A2W2C0Y9_9ACTN|nr:ROK family transcriptional regulator [Jiangella anatolica]PZF81929.1 hypothetical protein C1I92_19075 [Jiangella anatolica]